MSVILNLVKANRVPTFYCEYKPFNCFLSNLKVADNHPYFNVKSPDPVQTVFIHFADSELPVFSGKNLCLSLPQTMYMNITSSGIKEVLEDSFSECHYL